MVSVILKTGIKVVLLGFVFTSLAALGYIRFAPIDIAKWDVDPAGSCNNFKPQTFKLRFTIHLFN